MSLNSGEASLRLAVAASKACGVRRYVPAVDGGQISSIRLTTTTPSRTHLSLNSYVLDTKIWQLYPATLLPIQRNRPRRKAVT
jgi:hypothetical protein